jgi:predicted Zn-dependent protease
MKTIHWILLSIITAALLPARVSAHGDLHEQIAAVTQRIEKDPTNAAFYLKRGQLHRMHRDWDAAMADLDRAAMLDPDLSVVDLARGRTLLEANWPIFAKLTLDRFLAKQPTHADGLVTRARVLIKLNQPVAAAADFTRAIANRFEPEPYLFVERAQALASAGDDRIDEALRGLEEGVKQLGPLVTLQLSAIELELKRKRYDSALARLETITAQSPRKETWLTRRAEILAQAGRITEAREAQKAALAAIESLPPSRRQDQTTLELEARLRTELRNNNMSSEISRSQK